MHSNWIVTFPRGIFVILLGAGLAFCSQSLRADPPKAPTVRLNVLKALLNETGEDIDVDKLEPPGGEEYLIALTDLLEEALDDELEFCLATRMLSHGAVRSLTQEGKRRYEPEDREIMIMKAVDSGMKPARKSRGPGRLESVAKRWRRAYEKLRTAETATPQERDLKQLTVNNFDESQTGPLDANGLFQWKQSFESHNEFMSMIGDYFLTPVTVALTDIELVEDWRVIAKTAIKFGKKIKTGPNSETMINQIIQNTVLVGADDAFGNIEDDTKKYEAEGYFLFSRQGLTESDDVTNTMALAKSDELEEQVQAVRALVSNYVRLRAFRVKEMKKHLLQFGESEITAESLFPDAGGIYSSQDNSEERLHQLQELFGAPVGKRTRTKNSKRIEFAGILTKVSESGLMQVHVNSDVEGTPNCTVQIEPDQNPLGEQALHAKLKLGSEVSLVAKITKLEYATEDNEGLRFHAEPIIADQRGTKARSKSRDDGDAKAPKRRAARRGAVR